MAFCDSWDRSFQIGNVLWHENGGAAAPPKIARDEGINFSVKLYGSSQTRKYMRELW